MYTWRTTEGRNTGWRPDADLASPVSSRTGDSVANEGEEAVGLCAVLNQDKSDFNAVTLFSSLAPPLSQSWNKNTIPQL